jgi:hypothetical protein
MVKQLLWLLVGFPSVNNTGLWRAPVLVVDNPTPAVSDDSAYMSPPPPKQSPRSSPLCARVCCAGPGAVLRGTCGPAPGHGSCWS